MNKSPITIQTIVTAPISEVWDAWNDPERIKQWAFASDDWEATSAENDLRIGGELKVAMAAKDGSFGFDFGGIYTNIEEFSNIEFDMTDGRHVKTQFIESPEGVKIIESFDAESENSEDIQRAGWQAILDNFKKYVEC